MNLDPQDTRKISHTNWEYLKEMKETAKVARWVWREFVSHENHRRVRDILIIFGLSSLSINAVPFLLRYLLDGLIQHDTRTLAWSFAGMTVCTVVASQYFDWLHQVKREYGQGDNLTTLKRRMNELFFEKSLGQHLQESSRLNTANIERGKSRIDQLENMIAFEGIPALVSLAVAFTLLWVNVLSLHSATAGLFMTAVLVSYFFWLAYLNRNITEKCVPFDKEFRRLNRWQHERWEKIERVKTCAKEAAEIAYQDRAFRKVLGEERQFWLWFINKIILRGLSNRLLLLSSFAYGAWQVWQGHWTPGSLIPFTMYSMRVSENLWQIGHIEHQINWNMPAIRSAMSILAQPPDVTDQKDGVELAKDRPFAIEFDSVSYAYNRQDRESTETTAVRGRLEKVSFRIEPGEKVALIGPSGAGKTTIMRLLMRYMDVHAGAIRISGHDLRDVKLSSWLDLIGYIPQQAQVFDGTIRDNLLYRFPDEPAEIPDEELQRVMEKLRINFNLDTRVGRHGIELSGGEQQRLMIGAAAMRKPKFMIIDEATSSLDATTEKEVQRGLADILGPEMGALIITHRLNTVRNLCTKFIVIQGAEEIRGKESQVEARGGSFEDLYENSPTFRRLAEDQGITIEQDESLERVP